MQQPEAGILRKLEMLFLVLPPRFRLEIVDRVLVWANERRTDALRDLQREPPTPHDFTTHGENL